MKKIDKKAIFTKLLFFSRPKFELLNEVVDDLKEGRKLKLIFTPNPEQLIQARFNSDFFNILQQADYLLPDGIGLVWALRYLSKKSGFLRIKPPKERLAGVEVAEDLLKLSQKEDYKVLVIGGRDYGDQLSKWGENYCWLEGYQDKEHPTSEEEQVVLAKLKSYQPKIVFVTLGAPYQEKWLVDHRAMLEKSGVKLAMAAGGSFDMILGHLKRSPGLLRKFGLEWLFRLFQEPHRWRRQLRLLTFIKLVIWDHH